MNWGSIGQLFVFVFFLIVLIVLINLTKAGWKGLVRFVGGNKIVAGIVAAIIVLGGLPVLWKSSGDVVSSVSDSWSSPEGGSDWVLYTTLPAGGKAIMKSKDGSNLVVKDVWKTGQDTTTGKNMTYGGASFPIEIWVKKKDLPVIEFTQF